MFCPLLLVDGHSLPTEAQQEGTLSADQSQNLASLLFVCLLLLLLFTFGSPELPSRDICTWECERCSLESVSVGKNGCIINFHTLCV